MFERIGKPLAIVLTSLLSACTVGPEYSPPEQVNTIELTPYDSDIAFEGWWPAFEDNQLTALITTAVKQNRTIQQAAANVGRAQAVFADSTAQRWPQGALTGEYQASKNATLFTADSSTVNRLYTNGLSLSWDADIFGKLQRAEEAANARLDQATLLWRDAQLQIISQVATSYGEYRGAQLRLYYAEMNLRFLRQSLGIVEAQIDAGSATDLERTQVDIQIKQVETRIPAIKIARHTALSTLAALLGTTADALTLTASAGVPRLPAPLLINADKNYLRYRSDVASAERYLAASSALQGVATADLYPSLSISGFLGFLSSPSLVLNDSTESWRIAPALQWTGVNFSAAQARVRIAEADTAIALTQFEQRVIEAVNEMQLSFQSYQLTRQQLASVESQFAVSQRAVRIARDRYEAGTVDFLQLLESERALLDSRDQLAQIELAHFLRLVNVYEAFGGAIGFTDES